MKPGFYTRTIQLSIFFILLIPISAAGLGAKSYYHRNAQRLFWFMVISDTHIGAEGSQDTTFLAWATRQARDIINPQFIVNTGDLTDSTDGGIIPNGPYRDEWENYKQILDLSDMDPGFYYDIPGNHDAYNDEEFYYYRNYSFGGHMNKPTQHAWVKKFDFGSYLFMGVNTAGNDGASFSVWPWDNFGDHAGLDTSELAFIEDNLNANPDAEFALIFGHHPFEADASDWTETALTYGLDSFLNLIDFYGVSLYGYGHTHQYQEDVYFQDLSKGIFYINTDSLGKSNANHYTVMAIDGNGLAVTPADKDQWPVVLITAPMDRCLGECPNTFAYEVPQSKANPVRALVFDENPIYAVQFRIDGSTIWQNMQPLDGGPVWQGSWDARTSAAGNHTIEVRASGTTTKSDTVVTSVNPALNAAGFAEIIGAWNNGLLYWDFAALKWTQMTPFATTGDIAAGDFNGDGKADVASSWNSEGLWYQDGVTLAWTKIDNWPPFKVTAGDVTGDGRDEIIGTWSSGIWYWDVTASKWTQMTSYSTDGDIAAGDFNGDGKADVASIWHDGLWYQDGDNLVWIKIVSLPPKNVTAGDITGDGRAEIIGTWGDGIWYWDFTALKWTQMTFYTTDGDIAAGDFTGDGKADVASCWDKDGLWYQDGSTLGWTKVSDSTPNRLAAGDVTGD
jgi:hypothetical protein